MTDDDLSRRVTAAVRATPGVVDVFAAQPALEAAADAVAVRLSLRTPDALVDLDRADGFTTVHAHIATSAAEPAPDVLRTVGELIRSLVIEDGVDEDAIAVVVRVRLVEDVASTD